MNTRDTGGRGIEPAALLGTRPSYIPHRRLPWTPDEDAGLHKAWAERGTTNSVVFDHKFGAAIGRTKNSVAMRRTALGLNVGCERYRDAEERAIREGADMLTAATIALMQRMQARQQGRVG